MPIIKGMDGSNTVTYISSGSAQRSCIVVIVSIVIVIPLTIDLLWFWIKIGANVKLCNKLT